MRSLLNTVLNGYWLPTIFAAVELNRDHAGKRPPESCRILYSAHWIFATGSTQGHKWRQRKRAKGLPGFLHPLEGRRLRHSHPEGSQEGVREATVVAMFLGKAENRSMKTLSKTRFEQGNIVTATRSRRDAPNKPPLAFVVQTLRQSAA
jgi:hypothetical protein